MERAGTLVHETTHTLGTLDLVDLTIADVPRDVGIFGWDLNADTYEWWVENGACVPGYNCKPPYTPHGGSP